jgi:hypothetical protein
MYICLGGSDEMGLRMAAAGDMRLRLLMTLVAVARANAGPAAGADDGFAPWLWTLLSTDTGRELTRVCPSGSPSEEAAAREVCRQLRGNRPGHVRRRVMTVLAFDRRFLEIPPFRGGCGLVLQRRNRVLCVAGEKYASFQC